MPRKRNFDINKAHSFMLTIVLFSYNMEDIGEHDSNFPKYPDFETIKKHVHIWWKDAYKFNFNSTIANSCKTLLNGIFLEFTVY